MTIDGLHVVRISAVVLHRAAFYGRIWDEQERDGKVDATGVKVLQDAGTDRDLNSNEYEHAQPMSSRNRQINVSNGT